MTAKAQPLIPNLRERLAAVYEEGIAAGAIEYTPTEVTVRPEGPVEFEIRFAAALNRKPVPKSGNAKAKTDPFAPPYGPAYVAEYIDEEDDEGFVLLVRRKLGEVNFHLTRDQLNKYCVTPRHFLLCTKQFSSQLLPPTPTELYTSLRILQQFGRFSEGQPAEPHCAFFNCGDASGASQPHKHLQFVKLYTGTVPFEDEIEGCRPGHLRAGQTWSMPADVMPTFHVIADTSEATTLPSTQAKRFLGTNMLAVLDKAFDNLRHLASEQEPATRSRMSYNLIITTRFMLLAPRSKSDYTFADGTSLSLNALAFAGMVMTKQKEQLKHVEEFGVRKILLDVGYPRAEVANACQSEQQLDN